MISTLKSTVREYDEKSGPMHFPLSGLSQETRGVVDRESDCILGSPSRICQ